MSSPRRKTIGNYEVLRELGQGGMGVVYLATQPALERAVVIKSLRRGLADDPGLDERFRREAQAAAGIHHPNTVAVHDCFAWRGERFIVQEYIAGENLASALSVVRRFEPRIAALVALELSRGLEEIHARNVVHRDLKPANVLLGRAGEVKIADFGIAFEPGRSALTQAGYAIGTPAYMAPEQHRGERADSRSDLFSFGVLLFEMLTGVRPFPEPEDDDAPSIATQIEAGRYAPARKLAPGVPRWLSTLADQCLRTKPKRRLQSAALLRTTLERGVGRVPPADCRHEIAAWLFDRGVFVVAEDETEISRPQSARGGPRRRMRFALAAAASIAVVGGVGVIQLGDFPPGDVQAPSRIVTAQLKLVMPNDTEVRIDGALAQRTPGNVAIELRPGRHRISFRHPQLGSVDHIVELAPGGVRTLEPIFASRAEID